jgi:hypothetical protein
MTDLELLDVNDCGLRTINVGALNGLTNLSQLSISYEVSGILSGTFQNMKSLENLEMRYNTIEHVDSNVFSGLVNLNHVDLEINKLQYLNPVTFLALPNIQKLYLDFNLCLQTPTNRNFINSFSLSFLDISDIRMATLSVETFANVSALEWLALSYCILTTVDVDTLKALPKLSEPYLEGNPLHCDCHFQEVFRWCEDHNIDTGTLHQAPEYDTPIELKGMCWSVLQKGQCLEGNINYFGDYRSTSYRYPDIGE